MPSIDRHETETPNAMKGFDPSIPNVARMYDFYLGGKDHFEADRAAAEQIVRLSPSAAAAAHDNRRFLARAVSHVARSGITQFVDIGAGLPTVENTHEIAMKENRLSRVVYVDNDPVVINHARVILKPELQAEIMKGDLSEPRLIIENTVLRTFLDMKQPVAIILAAILHFFDDAHAYAIVGFLKDSVPRGSALLISHATADDATSAELQTVQSVYEDAAAPIYFRTQADVARFFDGFDIVDPGVVDINSWQAPGRPKDSRTIGYGGVAIKR